jgi:hypothetical protein
MEYTQKVKDVLAKQITDIGKVNGDLVRVRMAYNDNITLIFKDDSFAIFHAKHDSEGDIEVYLTKDVYVNELYDSGFLTHGEYREQRTLELNGLAEKTKRQELKEYERLRKIYGSK